jgi:hypothetical protein
VVEPLPVLVPHPDFDRLTRIRRASLGPPEIPPSDRASIDSTSETPLTVCLKDCGNFTELLSGPGRGGVTDD